MGGAKIYTSPDSLGVPASAAPNDFLAAMNSNSIFIVESTAVTSPDWNFPNAFSTLVIIKRFNGRVSIFLYGKEIANHDYRMFLDVNNTPSGEWYQYITNADIGVGFISSGSFNDIIETGVYYVANAVTDKPNNTGGLYILASAGGTGENRVGLYAANNSSARPYIVGNGWKYQL